MKICPICGGTIEESETVCPICGFILAKDEGKAPGAGVKFASKPDGPKGVATTWTCSCCGGIWDNSIGICPIDGYDHARELKEKNRGVKLGIAHRRLRHIVYAVLALTFIIAILSSISSVRSSGGAEVGRRLDYLFGQRDRLGTMQESVLTTDSVSVEEKRLERMGGITAEQNSGGTTGWFDTVAGRLSLTIRLDSTQERISYSKSLHGADHNMIRQRWSYALNRAEVTLFKAKTFLTGFVN